MHPEVFKSNSQTVAAVVGENNKNGDGIFGIGHGATGRGVVGTSDDQNAVSGIAKKGNGVFGDSTGGIGVFGQSQEFEGVRGISHAPDHGGVVGINDFHILKSEANSLSDLDQQTKTPGDLRTEINPLNLTKTQIAGPGVFGQSYGTGVMGEGIDGFGVHGHSINQHGVWGESDHGSGVTGIGHKWHGVYGHSVEQHGVWGESDQGSGVTGVGHKWHGVFGQADDQVGVFGQSTTGRGVVGVSNGAATGVEGFSKDGIGVFGKGGHLAGRFEGNVEVTGDLTFPNAADFAEDFDVIELTEPGDVMVLTETDTLKPSSKEYDKKVVGVVSGAGDYKPGIILDKQNNNKTRKPIAMMGKVFCKVDADSSPIETGDMLTTSNIPGYAMKALDPFKAFGAVIGKALASLNAGKGLIPILVVSQ